VTLEKGRWKGECNGKKRDLYIHCMGEEKKRRGVSNHYYQKEKKKGYRKKKRDSKYPYGKKGGEEEGDVSLDKLAREGERTKGVPNSKRNHNHNLLG